MFLCWVLASESVKLLGRLFSSAAAFEDTASVFGFGIGVATRASLIHDLTDAVLGVLGVIQSRMSSSGAAVFD